MSIHANSRTNEVLDVIAQSSWHMDILRAVKELDLNDWMIGAGFVRNAVWDHLHQYECHTPLSDVDVIHFDPIRSTSSYDEDYEGQLAAMNSSIPWSVRNQARMHMGNDDEPYLSSEDAMVHWLETPTCVGVKLSDEDSLLLIAPHGVLDLLNLEVCPTPSGYRKPEIYRNRIAKKNWSKNWPGVRIFYAD